MKMALVGVGLSLWLLQGGTVDVAAPPLTTPTGWFDVQIHLSDVLLVGGGIWAYLRTNQRNLDRLAAVLDKVVTALGVVHPPSGILGDISELKRESRRHRDWLIEQGIIDPRDRT